MDLQCCPWIFSRIIIFSCIITLIVKYYYGILLFIHGEYSDSDFLSPLSVGLCFVEIKQACKQCKQSLSCEPISSHKLEIYNIAPSRYADYSPLYSSSCITNSYPRVLHCYSWMFCHCCTHTPLTRYAAYHSPPYFTSCFLFHLQSNLCKFLLLWITWNQVCNLLGLYYA